MKTRQRWAKWRFMIPEGKPDWSWTTKDLSCVCCTNVKATRSVASQSHLLLRYLTEENKCLLLGEKMHFSHSSSAGDFISCHHFCFYCPRSPLFFSGCKVLCLKDHKSWAWIACARLLLLPFLPPPFSFFINYRTLYHMFSFLSTPPPFPIQLVFSFFNMFISYMGERNK